MDNKDCQGGKSNKFCEELSIRKCMDIIAMFRCVVRLELKGCDLYCDGSGYVGDRNVI